MELAVAVGHYSYNYNNRTRAKPNAGRSPCTNSARSGQGLQVSGKEKKWSRRGEGGWWRDELTNKSSGALQNY